MAAETLIRGPARFAPHLGAASNEGHRLRSSARAAAAAQDPGNAKARVPAWGADLPG